MLEIIAVPHLAHIIGISPIGNVITSVTTPIIFPSSIATATASSTRTTAA